MAADSFTGARTLMLEQQLLARGIRDTRVLTAMKAVPREDFLPPEYIDRAYDDCAVAIGYEQTISQPYMVAIMTQALRLAPEAHVLEVGTGSGYQAAVLAHLVRDVVTVERIHELAVAARARLGRLGLDNVTVIEGDGSSGWPDAAPFDGILVTAAAPTLPHVLVEQLDVGGRMVIPVGTRRKQMCLQVTRTAERVETRDVTACVFVPLRGAYGWKE